jgi:hypothetical protein
MNKACFWVEKIGTKYYVWVTSNGRRYEVHRTRSGNAAHKSMRKAAELVAFVLGGRVRLSPVEPRIDILA